MNGVGNNYLDGAVGPTCEGWYPFSRMSVDENIVFMSGTYNLNEWISLGSNSGITCNNTILDGTNGPSYTQILFLYSNQDRGQYEDLKHRGDQIHPYTYYSFHVQYI